MTNITNKAILRRKYQEKFQLLQRLQEAAKVDIEELLKQNDIITNAVIGRVKTFDSFFKKAQDGVTRGKFTDPINEIQDLLGVRVILIFIDDLEKVSNLLSPTFKVLHTERKSDSKSENTFGYESDHYTLQYNQVKGPRYKDLMSCTFELQVRTILMDAWASLSHEIDYKTNGSIPSELKRIFFGLSGMFVVADKTFQDLRTASKANQDKLLESDVTLEKILTKEINLDTFKTYLAFKFKDRAEEESRLIGSDAEYSEFIDELKSVGGYSILKDIEEGVINAGNIEQNIEDTLLKESRSTEESIAGGMHIVGTLRATFDLYDDKYFERTKDWSINNYWKKIILESKELITKKKER